MDGESSQLPWNELQQTDGVIPWPALRTFAEALATDDQLTPRLFEVYDRAYQEAFERPTCADFYVAAIFALAAPRLDQERRREIGAFLVAKLVQAGRDDADVSLEVLEAAAGTMGPVIVPAVLDAIANEPDTFGAWLFLWDLTKLAAQSEDEALRGRVIQACVALLEKVERDEVDPGDGMNAAWVLASFQRPEHEDLLRRLSEKPMEHWWIADYRAAFKLLQGRPEHAPPPELWEQPVEEWLTSRCRMVEETAAETGEREEKIKIENPDESRAQSIAISFALSPVAAGLPQELREYAYLVVERLLYFSFSQLDTSPRDWDESRLRELLLNIVPRRLLAERDMLEKVIPITEALLYWLRFEGLLPEADALAQTIHGWTDQVVAAGMDPRNWGSPKTTVMKAVEAGLDLRKPQVQEALANQTVAEFSEPPTEPLPSPPGEPPIPIVEHSPKPARNAPCPCGSGKKYKKCHGRPGAEQTSHL